LEDRKVRSPKESSKEKKKTLERDQVRILKILLGGLARKLGREKGKREGGETDLEGENHSRSLNSIVRLTTDSEAGEGPKTQLQRKTLHLLKGWGSGRKKKKGKRIAN